METRYAIIENGVVSNIATAYGEWPHPEVQTVVIPDGVFVDIGYPSDPSQWASVTASRNAISQVPDSVSRFQARAALLHAGYLDTIESYMANPSTPRIQKLAWTDAQEFRRNSPLVESLGAMLGMNTDQLDSLFIQASTIIA